LLVDDQNLVDLLDDLLLESVVDDLEVLLLDLDDLLLVVEVIEAIDEAEVLVESTTVALYWGDIPYAWVGNGLSN
jgi:hypothetical protein